MYDWYYGADVVQVEATAGVPALATANTNANGDYVDAPAALYVVDASKPDAPTLSSASSRATKDGWWGNLRAVGDQL